MNTTSARAPEWMAEVVCDTTVQPFKNGPWLDHWWYQLYIRAFQEALSARLEERTKEQIRE